MCAVKMPQISRYIPIAWSTSLAGAEPKSVWPVSHQNDIQNPA